jgi:GT2 family glycosyltransferase
MNTDSSDNPAATVTAVISTHNRRGEVATTLQRLYALHPSIGVIIVDNASDDGTADLVGQAHPSARVIRQDHNDPLHGYNLGFDAADTPYVLVLDDDSCPKAGTLDAMLASLERSPRVVAAAGNIVSPAGESEWGAAGNVEYTEAWYNLIGCGFLVRREALRQADGYKEQFSLYYNDLDLGLRLLSLGHALAYSRNWQFEHRKSAVGRIVHRKTRMMFRNFSLIVRHYFSGMRAADLLAGHTLVMLRRAAREGCLISSLGSLLGGVLLCFGGKPSPIPPGPGLTAFVETYAFSANLRKALRR